MEIIYWPCSAIFRGRQICLWTSVVAVTGSSIYHIEWKERAIQFPKAIWVAGRYRFAGMLCDCVPGCNGQIWRERRWNAPNVTVCLKIGNESKALVKCQPSVSGSFWATSKCEGKGEVKDIVELSENSRAVLFVLKRAMYIYAFCPMWTSVLLATKHAFEQAEPIAEVVHSMFAEAWV